MAATPAEYDDQLLQVHLAQASATLPGPDYYTVLGWIHEILHPANYVEIGIRHGDSLRLAGPTTRCIGIDPEPTIEAPLPPNVQVFRLTSNEFFETCKLADLLGSNAFSLAFIDGLHLFEQALLDFVNLERNSAADSVIMIHDCLPLDKVTADRVRSTHFYSGDVWKLAMCLRIKRPDLRLKTIRTGPSGLCLVSHLDSQSQVLSQSYHACLAEYLPLDYNDYLSRPQDMPGTVANSFEGVRSCLAELRRA